MEIKSVNTFTVTIYVGGSYESTCEFFRRECFVSGWCVTIERTKFIYTGGEEDGVRIGIVNYPRFPSAPQEVMKRVTNLIEPLLNVLYQRSCLVVNPTDTIWYSRACPGETR